MSRVSLCVSSARQPTHALNKKMEEVSAHDDVEREVGRRRAR